MTIHIDEYDVDGIRVLHTAPVQVARTESLLLVHGGCHGAWCWDKYLPYFASSGWDCHALNWRGRGGSAQLAETEAVSRPLELVAEDIAAVAATFAIPPVVVAHSMGGLVALKFAETNVYSGLVLITPVLPEEASPTPIDLVFDPGQLWGPPHLDLAKILFFTAASEDDARRYHSMLVSESARAVEQAVTDKRISIDPVKISGPILVVAAEKDVLCPPEEVWRLANLLGADYHYAFGLGHGVMMAQSWKDVAQAIHRWLITHTVGLDAMGGASISTDHSPLTSDARSSRAITAVTDLL